MNFADLVWRLVRKPGFGASGVGLSHAEAIRLTLPQMFNLLRPESKTGGPVPTASQERRELERRQQESVITMQAAESIRRGRRK